MSVASDLAAASVAAVDLSSLPPQGTLLGAVQPTAPAAAAAQQDGTESATVVGNSLTSFTAYVSAQHKDDLNNSLALAQLMAVKEGHDPTADPIGYYTYVQTFLQQIGYTGQNISFGDYTASTATVQIDQVVLEILGAILAPAELGIVEAAVKALQGSADSGGAPWSIYSSSSTSNNAGTFAVGLANETNGSVALQVGAFTFSGTETSTKFLWMSYSATSVHIKNGSTQLSLNDAVYAGVRASVQQKIASHAASYIANLPDLG
ncbi:hypothetical protein [Cellulomonas fimi]|uniref:Uncharacterized protein n=1 Tax=Cellulomonas fimi (strain ATCC 484 / DSM 20113 / JCM 1341 / CCUG 24087 / LMG 16345 / NBRC 15513 / NCIMB 8980 / NCTC 7547 / NRS-133) TaxID=590998 RepID=F4H3U2_CELFA|nr:hypothetical protein [Cellulomonas fimi]AEE44166.1 hypothetical protein Celf_0014 [Cellulomonas fimi ATCC 484]NNH07569.1 hypothetical protein [Cellulomonas fimi]VEH25799.1 Uncharacterised protein [Cellulomonas fimi]